MLPVVQSITVGQIPGVPGDCFRAAVASVMELPLEAVPHFMLFGNRWVDALTHWIESRGYVLRCTEDPEEVPLDSYYLLTGKSPRGDFNHTVVARNGAMVHDPHPEGAGVETFLHAIWGAPLVGVEREVDI